MLALAQPLGESIERMQGLVDALVQGARRGGRGGCRGEVFGFELITRVEEVEPIHNQFLTNRGQRGMRGRNRAVTGIGDCSCSASVPPVDDTLAGYDPAACRRFRRR